MIVIGHRVRTIRIAPIYPLRCGWSTFTHLTLVTFWAIAYICHTPKHRQIANDDPLVMPMKFLYLPTTPMTLASFLRTLYCNDKLSLSIDFRLQYPNIGNIQRNGDLRFFRHRLTLPFSLKFSTILP